MMSWGIFFSTPSNTMISRCVAGTSQGRINSEDIRSTKCLKSQVMCGRLCRVKGNPLNDIPVNMFNSETHNTPVTLCDGHSHVTTRYDVRTTRDFPPKRHAMT